MIQDVIRFFVLGLVSGLIGYAIGVIWLELRKRISKPKD